MHSEAFEFVSRHATNEPVSVIEIGSRDINGSVRSLFPHATWTGLDLVEGPSVDIVIDAEQYTPTEMVDVVVCCEVLEHAVNWRELMRVALSWIKPGGRMIMTCAGPGRPEHSASDGGPLQADEHYQNLSTDTVHSALDMVEIVEAEQRGPDSYLVVRKRKSITRFDNILPDHIARTAAVSIPADDWQWWHRYDSGKLASVDPSRIPSGCRIALEQIALSLTVPDGAFIDFDFHGAGMHVMPSGCSLGRHTDAAFHPLRNWQRVASVVWFANEPESGGELVVGGESITPQFNTAIMFDGSVEHCVNATTGRRETLSLFLWRTVDEKPRGAGQRSDFS